MTCEVMEDLELELPLTHEWQEEMTCQAMEDTCEAMEDLELKLPFPHEWQDEMTSEAMEDIELKLPPGYRFLPTDEELVTEYLMPKVEGRPPPLAFMKDVDDKEIYSCSPYDHALQGKGSPLSDVIVNENERRAVWYFFTPAIDSIHRIDFNGIRVVTAEGFWKTLTFGEPIRDSNGNILAFKRCLAYFRGTPPKGKKTRWMMDEYILADENNKEKNCYVLGRIRYKPTA